MDGDLGSVLSSILRSGSPPESGSVEEVEPSNSVILSNDFAVNKRQPETHGECGDDCRSTDDGGSLSFFGDIGESERRSSLVD